MSKEYSEFCTLPCKVLMNKAPPIAQASENIVALTNRLLDIDYKVVVVYEDAEPIGLVTLKDIMKWLVRSENKEEALLKELITVPLIMVDLNSPLQEALDLTRFWESKQAFFETDTTAAFLTHYKYIGTFLGPVIAALNANRSHKAR